MEKRIVGLFTARQIFLRELRDPEPSDGRLPQIEDSRP